MRELTLHILRGGCLFKSLASIWLLMFVLPQTLYSNEPAERVVGKLSTEEVASIAEEVAERLELKSERVSWSEGLTAVCIALGVLGALLKFVILDFISGVAATRADEATAALSEAEQEFQQEPSLQVTGALEYSNNNEVLDLCDASTLTIWLRVMNSRREDIAIDRIVFRITRTQLPTFLSSYQNSLKSQTEEKNQGEDDRFVGLAAVEVGAAGEDVQIKQEENGTLELVQIATNPKVKSGDSRYNMLYVFVLGMSHAQLAKVEATVYPVDAEQPVTWSSFFLIGSQTRFPLNTEINLQGVSAGIDPSHMATQDPGYLGGGKYIV